MRKTRVRTGLFAVLTAMWMLLIFLFSAQDASKSGAISDNFSRFIVNFLEPGEHVGTTQSSNTASSGKASGSESVEAFAPSGNSKTYDPVPNKNWFGIDRLKFKAFIRKSGHFRLFMGLGALVLLTLRSYYSDWPEQKSVLWRVHLSAWLACVCYAFCDEFHQLFVKGRDARFRDVFIDSCGALVGVLLTVLVLKLIACMRRKHIPKRKIS